MAESQDVIERDGEATDASSEGAVADPEPTVVATPVILLDRSRCQLRLPADIVTDCLQLAEAIKYSRTGVDGVSAHSELIERLRAAAIIVDDELDAQVADLLDVANQASLMINVELRFGSDSSSSIVWATPRQAVVSASIDPEMAEFRPVDVFQLPYVLSDLMVARPPSHVGEAPISVATQAVAEAEEVLDDRDTAAKILTEAGLSDEQAAKVLAFQEANVRRWRVQSTWSTDSGQESAELRGIDAGPNGQWLVAMTGNRENRGQLTFTPQGHGDVMRAIRSLMPRSWIGTPLRSPNP